MGREENRHAVRGTAHAGKEDYGHHACRDTVMRTSRLSPSIRSFLPYSPGVKDENMDSANSGLSALSAQDPLSGSRADDDTDLVGIDG